MYRRSLRALSALTLALAVLLGLARTAGAAGAKDKDAQKLLDSAMNEDYLSTEFAKAEKKLKDALAKCGKAEKDCSPELVGKIQIALGTVYGVGLSKNAEAKDAFIAALKADPKAELDKSLTTPELQKIFDEAKKGSGGSSGTTTKPETKPETKPPSGDATHTPPAEGQVNTPLPLYIEPSDEVPLSKVVVRYKPFGAPKFDKSKELSKVGKGYGGTIPCEDTSTTGDLKYYFAFTGADGEAAGGLGSNKEPFKTTIKNELEGDAPHLPGKKPPEQCKDISTDCPPGLAGCPEKPKGECAKRGDKGWGSSCDANCDCKEGLTCLNGTCAEGGPEPPPGGGPDEKKRMNLIGLGVQFDMLALNGVTNACQGYPVINYVCFIQGTGNQFYGSPVAFRNTDGIQGGADFGGARILLSYDRQLVKKIGLSLGLRIGYYIGGPGSPSNTPPPTVTNPKYPLMAGDPMSVPTPQSTGKAYLPFHGELRMSYHFGGSMMDNTKTHLRPYIFLGGGGAQVNASVPVALCDANVTSADMAAKARSCNLPSGQPTVLRNVDAYQVTGLGFFGFGGGTTIGITPLFGIFVESKFMFMIPTFGFVWSPNIGPVFNF